MDTIPSVYPGVSPVVSGTRKHRKYLSMSRYLTDDDVVTHNNSLANLCRGVGERVLYTNRQLKLPTVVAYDGVFSERLGVYKRLLVTGLGRQSPVSRQDFVNYYKGPRRTLYQKAADSLVYKPVGPRDSRLKTFIKAEKINLSLKPDPALRVIQPRDPRFNVEVGKYLLPLEHKIYDAIDKLFTRPTIMSKYNSLQQACVIHDHFTRFPDCAVIGLDASRFDQHVSVPALQFEHSVYNELFNSPELRKLLRMQLKNRGVARGNDGWFKYEKKGSRMSGDMNTSLGNKLLMCFMAKAYIDHVGVDIGFVNNGDDCLLFVSRKYLSKLDGLEEYFRDFGFNIVREKAVFEMEHIEFCQCKPVKVNGVWRMIRSVKTSLVKDVTAVSLGHDITQYRRWLFDVAGCGLAFGRDLPVMGSFYRMLERFGVDGGTYQGKNALFNSMRVLSKGVDVEFTQPDDYGRYSFWLQTGLTPQGQLELEQYFDLAQWGGDNRHINRNLSLLIKNGS